MFRFLAFVALFVSAVVAERPSELVLLGDEKIGEVVKTARPHTYLNMTALPAEYDLRKSGLLTTDLNQHIPVYW